MNAPKCAASSPVHGLLHRFCGDESGVTAIEYGLIAAATGLALAAVMPTIKANLTSTYTAVGNNLQ